MIDKDTTPIFINPLAAAAKPQANVSAAQSRATVAPPVIYEDDIPFKGTPSNSAASQALTDNDKYMYMSSRVKTLPNPRKAAPYENQEIVDQLKALHAKSSILSPPAAAKTAEPGPSGAGNVKRVMSLQPQRRGAPYENQEIVDREKALKTLRSIAIPAPPRASVSNDPGEVYGYNNETLEPEQIYTVLEDDHDYEYAPPSLHDTGSYSDPATLVQQTVQALVLPSAAAVTSPGKPREPPYINQVIIERQKKHTSSTSALPAPEPETIRLDNMPNEDYSEPFSFFVPPDDEIVVKPRRETIGEAMARLRLLSTADIFSFSTMQEPDPTFDIFAFESNTDPDGVMGFGDLVAAQTDNLEPVPSSHLTTGQQALLGPHGSMSKPGYSQPNLQRKAAHAVADETYSYSHLAEETSVDDFVQHNYEVVDLGLSMNSAAGASISCVSQMTKYKHAGIGNMSAF